MDNEEWAMGIVLTIIIITILIGLGISIGGSGTNINSSDVFEVNGKECFLVNNQVYCLLENVTIGR